MARIVKKLAQRAGLDAAKYAGHAQLIELFLAEVGADSRHTGGSVLLASLEDRLSNAVRITDRQRIQVTSVQDTLKALAKYLA